MITRLGDTEHQLPPDTYPSQAAGTRFSYPEGIEGWVDFSGW